MYCIYQQSRVIYFTLICSRTSKFSTNQNEYMRIIPSNIAGIAFTQNRTQIVERYHPSIFLLILSRHSFSNHPILGGKGTLFRNIQNTGR